ncbi:Spore cortex-lytic enzyme precursor [Pseudoruegeria aquimaris]|uniref:Spore cortex-lytic enzyme n=1 Tax=Pseudoruegeria aquimaris TaxID=393663 RepID=A0A1Y5SJS0_9RHOB|nr:cell wall hydrolase [Pseudoruegeria aquimaris]SLN41219.1 Spore cortex-lytic enzyme precursor [Pseudoruegeria aquimaris]
MRLQLRKALAVAGLTIFYGVTGHASETLSSSSDPIALVGPQLNRLMMQERSALEGVTDAYLNQLTTSLKPKPRPKNLTSGISYTREWLRGQPPAKGDEQWECLAKALYFEARGESIKGQFAVAEVILNRVDSASYPDTICEVVHQGTGRKYQCQFTFTCDGHEEVIREKKAYSNVGKIALAAMEAHDRPLTGGATHYHTKAVSPSWARKFPRTATIGVHHFYRKPIRVSKR